jgi:NAD(P)-dependent dehydrogenase (short-subunit alcohol dehydrogenase family)
MSGRRDARLNDRVCLVTGATGGMGAAIVRALVAAGARVVATDRSSAELEALAEPHGSVVVGHAADLADDGVAEALVALAVQRFGRLDAAVNAAGIEHETVPLHLTTDESFDRLMDINVRAVFRCMRAEIAAMLAAGTRGSIVNIASTNSFRPQHDQPAYTASKHAVLGLTRSAALDYGVHGIRVNAICPGAIDTPMLRDAMERRGRDADEVARRLTRFGRFGTPDEIADAAVWLCSDESSFTTGHALAVDGGMLGT